MTWVPTLADAEEWVRQKDARDSWLDICNASHRIMDREWKKTDQYKAIVKAKQVQARQQKMREAMEREAREKHEAELKAKREARKAEYQKAAEENVAREHRSRRSRIDWEELIDNPVTVERQIQWERRATALAMHKAGLSYGEIGKRLGVTRSRAAQVVFKAEQERKHRENQISPAEAYMNAECHKEVMDLVPREVATMRAIKPFQYHALAGFGG